MSELHWYRLTWADEQIRRMNAQQRAEAQRPVKTIAYANAQLDDMAKELRDARAEAERLREDVRNRTEERDRLREGWTEERERLRAETERLRAQVSAVADNGLALSRRALAAEGERDRLRAERDELACAALGTEAPNGFQKFKGSVGAVLKEIRDLHARADNWHDAIREIALSVWPGQDPNSYIFALADLVEAVRALGSRDANRLAALDKISEIVWPGSAHPFVYALPTLVEAVRKMGAERDEARSAELASDVARIRVLLGERDTAGKALDLAGQVRELKDERDSLRKELEARAIVALGSEDRHRALNEIAALLLPEQVPGATVYPLADLVLSVRNTVDSLRGAVAERDALQKRIDAAKERIAFASTSTDPNLTKLGSELVRILEGIDR